MRSGLGLLFLGVGSREGSLHVVELFNVSGIGGGVGLSFCCV